MTLPSLAFDPMADTKSQPYQPPLFTYGNRRSKIKRIEINTDNLSLVAPIDRSTWLEDDTVFLPCTFKVNRKYAVVLMCFFGLFVAYLIRISLSQAMIPMALHYGWDEATQGHLFAAFYYGYLLTQIPGGWASQMFGSKYVILGGILGSSLLNTLVPIISSNVSWFVLLRILTGFVQGVFYPSCLHLLSCWIEPKSRSIAVAFVVSGQHLGTAVAQGGYPYFADRLGWRNPFYLIGILGFIWSLLWVYLVESKPMVPVPSATSSILISTTPIEPCTHNNDDDEDEMYYQCYRGPLREVSPVVELQSTTTLTSCNSHEPLSPWPNTCVVINRSPWYDLFSHGAVWAYFLLFFCYNWSFYLLVSYLPKYLTSILAFSSATSGKITVFAYVCLYASILIGGRLSTFLLSKKISTPTFTRKCGVVIGLVPSIILLPLIGAGLFDSSKVQIAIVIIISIGFSGVAQASYAPNPMDLYPKSPALMASIGNSIGTLPGFLSSILAGWILQRGNCTWHTTRFIGTAAPSSCIAAWGIVFGSCSIVSLFGLVIWLFFASGTPIRSRRFQTAAAL